MLWLSVTGCVPSTGHPAPPQSLLPLSCGCVVLHVGLWNAGPLSASFIAGGLGRKSQQSGHRKGLEANSCKLVYLNLKCRQEKLTFLFTFTSLQCFSTFFYSCSFSSRCYLLVDVIQDRKDSFSYQPWTLKSTFDRFFFLCLSFLKGRSKVNF